jgi:trigger factor
MPKINVNKINKTRFSAHVKTSVEEKAECDKKAFENIRSKVKIDGFRKGKVPEHIIRSRYAEELENDSVNNLINLASEQLISETDKDIYKIRKVENLEPEKGGYAFDLIFDVQPDINLGKMKGVLLKENIPIIDEKDVQKEIREIQKDHAEKKLKADDGVALPGDFIVVGYEQWADNAPIGELVENIEFYLGEFKFDKEIEEELISAKVKKGQEHRITKKVKQNNGVDKSVDIIIYIDDIYEITYPELTDEMAVKYDAGYASAKELRNDVQKVLGSRFHRKNMDFEIGLALDKLNETAEIEFPDNYVQEKLQKYLEENNIDLNTFPEKERDEFKVIFEQEQKKRLINEYIMKEALGDIKSDVYRSGFVKFIEENFDKKMFRTFNLIYESVLNQNDKNQFGNQFINRLLQIYHLNILEKYFRGKSMIKKDSKIEYSTYMTAEINDAGV